MPNLAIEQFAQWGVATATPSYAAFDLLDGGTLYLPESDLMHREGIRGQDFIVYGMIQPRVTLRGILQTGAWCQHGLRAAVASLPQQLVIQAGLEEAAAAEAFTMSGAYINELALSCGGVNEPVRYTVDILGTTLAALGAPSPEDALDDKPMEWYQSGTTLDDGGGAAAYIMDSWEATLRNGMAQRGSLDAGVADHLRDTEYIKVGRHSAEARVTTREPLNVDLTGDAPEDVVWEAIIAISNGTLDGGVTMSNLRPQAVPQEIGGSGEDEVLWATPFEGVYWDLDSWQWVTPA